MTKKSTAITKGKSRWLWQWAEPESTPAVIPRSKTARLSVQSKLANVDAERAISRAYQAELFRTKAIGEAMYKSGKALRYSLVSAGRQIFLRVEHVRRRLEPGYRNRYNI